MKTTLNTIAKTCLGLLLAVVTSLNAQNSNNLVVFSETGDRFYLILNGLKYNQKPETNVKVTNLNAANYKAKIIFEKAVGDLNSNVYLMWEGAEVTNKEFTYAIHKKGEGHKLKFISHADIGGANANSTSSVVYNANGTAAGNTTTSDANVAVNSNSNATSTGVNGGGSNSTTTVTTTTTSAAMGGPNNGNVGMNVSVDGLNMSINVNGTGTGTGTSVNTASNSNTSVTTTTTTYSSSSSSSGGGAVQNTSANTGTTNANATSGCYSPMNTSSFDELVTSINAKSFEDAKLKVAKQGVSANCVSAAQVRKLMELFSFEENKLDITKYCYDYTTDKNNYFKVNDGFSFDSSVDTLNEYISKKK